MSGHSKFANIKHKKEKNDAAKGKVFTRIGREIAVAVKEGGADPANNSKLRDVVAKAKANNMPNDTIDRSIKKAAGDANAANYESITYEGYGPSGTAIIVETLTDNRNRTASNVRNAFTKGSGNVGTNGCVSFMFDRKGQIIVDKEEYEGDADELMMIALDAGEEDFKRSFHCIFVFFIGRTCLGNRFCGICLRKSGNCRLCTNFGKGGCSQKNQSQYFDARHCKNRLIEKNGFYRGAIQ